MIVSKRKYYRRLYITLLLVGGLISVSTLLANKYLFHMDMINTACKYTLLFTITVFISGFIVLLIKHHGLKGYLIHNRLLNSIEMNLLAIGAYTQLDGKVFAVLPKIRIKQNTIRISMDNLKIRSAIEKYLESFSTALPERFIVEDYYFAQTGAELIIQYEDTRSYVPEEYSIDKYICKVQSMAPSEIYLDRMHTIDLNDYPHWIVSGSSGSGKSYLTNEIVIQAIVKDWEIVICDPKRSYGLYRNYVEYAYEPEDILKALQSVETEMKTRLEHLQPLLDSNPRTLAIDAGYKPMMVIVEEYISLQATLPKKEREELERIIKSISVLARQSSIHLIMVMQASGTENIGATTRSNMSKILLGNAQSNIKTATFGTGVDIPYSNSKMDKGQGLIQMDRITLLRVPKVTDIECFKEYI